MTFHIFSLNNNNNKKQLPH